MGFEHKMVRSLLGQYYGNKAPICLSPKKVIFRPKNQTHGFSAHFDTLQEWLLINLFYIIRPIGCPTLYQ